MIKSQFFEGTDFQFNVFFNLHSGTDKQGRRRIQLKTIIKGERAVIDIGAKVEDKYWRKKGNGRNEEAIVSSEATGEQQRNCQNINELLAKVLGFCYDYADAVCISNQPNKPTIEHSKENFIRFIKAKLNREEEQNDAERFIVSFINRKKHAGEVENDTISNHLTVLKRLREYCQSQRCKLTWRLFNYDFEQDFHAWANNLYKPTTIASTKAIMRQWLKAAYKKRVHGLSSAFADWKIVKGNDTEGKIYLTNEEIQRIYNLDFNSEEIKSQIAHNKDLKSLEDSRDLFVIAALTSLRHSDWDANLQNAEVIDEQLLKVYCSKTKKFVYCPYNGMIKDIVAKHGGLKHLPTPPSLSTIEDNVRLCAKLAGITDEIVIDGKRMPKYKAVTTHTARRSFVSNHIANGARYDAIAASTGHTTTTLIEHYNKNGIVERAKTLLQAV